MIRGSFIVDQGRDVPPVNLMSEDESRHTKCGWCKAHVGEEHETECVTRERSVVLRLSFEFVSTIPESWSQETLEFVHNGNSFCASNYLDTLAHERDFCVCGGISYVREASEVDEEDLPWAYKWSGNKESRDAL